MEEGRAGSAQYLYTGLLRKSFSSSNQNPSVAPRSAFTSQNITTGVKNHPKMTLVHFQPIPDLVQVCLNKFTGLKHHLKYYVDRANSSAILPAPWEQQFADFQGLVAMIGADRQLADETSLDYKLRYSPYTNIMLKTHLGIIEQVLDQTLLALNGGPATSAESDVEWQVPENKLRDALAFYHHQLRGPIESLSALAPIVLPDHPNPRPNALPSPRLNALECVLKNIAFMTPRVVESLHPRIPKRNEGQVEVKPCDKPQPAMFPQTVSQGRGSQPLHHDQNTGGGSLLSSTQPISHRASTDNSHLKKPMVDRNAPTQSLKRRATDKPSQSHKRQKTGIRIDKTPSDAIIAKIESE